MLDKIKSINGTTSIDRKEDLEKLTEDELRILQNIRAKQMMRMEDTLSLKNYNKDAIDGFAPNLKHGQLGLVPKETEDTLSKLEVPVVDLLVEIKATEPTKPMNPEMKTNPELAMVAA